jgi:hypothetical protein
MVNRIKFRLNHHLLLIHQKKNNLQLSNLEVLSLMENFKWITFLVSVIRNTNFGSHHVINIKNFGSHFLSLFFLGIQIKTQENTDCNVKNFKCESKKSRIVHAKKITPQ